MAEITLVADTGRVTGSPPSRRMRAHGRIPAVVYGHGIEPASVSVDGRDLRHALSGEAGLNQLLALSVDGHSHLALARELQRHPVRNTVMHVDFQVVSRDQVISSEVPIVLVGEARAVEQDKGLVEQVLTFLTVQSVPASIPNSIEVDISGLSVGDSVRVGDLPLPEGVTTETDPEETVVVAAASAAAEAEAETEGEGGEGEGPQTEAGGASGDASSSGEG